MTLIRKTIIPSAVSLACARTHSPQSPTQLVCLSQNTSGIFQAFARDFFFFFCSLLKSFYSFFEAQLKCISPLKSSLFPPVVVLIAITTDYHKCSHLKQHPVLLVRSPVQWGSAGFSVENLRTLKSGCLWGCVPFWRLWR